MSTRSANRPVIEADLEQVERQLQYFGQGLRIASADGAVEIAADDGNWNPGAVGQRRRNGGVAIDESDA